MARDKKYFKEIVKTFPTKPGVYLMKNQDQKIIYIGKAKNLKNRVNSYFNNNIDHESKVGKLVQKINDIDYIVTDNELEALILESNLIKKNKPLYNILLKDDKGYKFIKVSSGPSAKITVVNKKQNDQSIYFGPYMSSFMAKQIVDLVNKIFKLSACNRALFQKNKYNRPCLNYYINLCSAPCCDRISASDYQDVVAQAVECLKSGMGPVIKKLKKQMALESESLNFEEAAKTRDKIKALEKANISSNVVISEHKNVDVLFVVFFQNYFCGTILIFRDYQLIDKAQYLVLGEEVMSGDQPSQTDFSEVRKTILLNHYVDNHDFEDCDLNCGVGFWPNTICLDGVPQDFELIKTYLLKEKNVDMIFETKNKELKKVLEIAKNNSKERIFQELKLTAKEVVNLNKLKTLLNLKNLPRKIEAFDISNFGSQIVVGAMIAVVDGVFKKSDYRRFRVKDLLNQDDYKSMAQVIERRLTRYKINTEMVEKESAQKRNCGNETQFDLKASSKDNSFLNLPDLILVDGGFGHVSVVSEILKKFDLKIPVYGMVKNGKHQTDLLVSAENKKIEIKNDKDLFFFIKQIQDEIHRFTINYSRKLYNKI